MVYNTDTCPVLGSPDGGSVKVETNGAATTAFYTCDAGYALYGVTERTCQDNGTWSDAPPTCSKFGETILLVYSLKMALCL